MSTTVRVGRTCDETLRAFTQAIVNPRTVPSLGGYVNKNTVIMEESMGIIMDMKSMKRVVSLQ